MKRISVVDSTHCSVSISCSCTISLNNFANNVFSHRFYRFNFFHKMRFNVFCFVQLHLQSEICFFAFSSPIFSTLAFSVLHFSVHVIFVPHFLSLSVPLSSVLVARFLVLYFQSTLDLNFDLNSNFYIRWLNPFSPTFFSGCGKNESTEAFRPYWSNLIIFDIRM